MIIELLLTITFLLFQVSETNNQNIYYSVIHDSVLCNNSITEYHYISNIEYETVVCIYSLNKNKVTLLFLIPPESVSNTVQCVSLSKELEYCPTPLRIESNREVITGLDNMLDSATIYDWINNQPD